MTGKARLAVEFESDTAKAVIVDVGAVDIANDNGYDFLRAPVLGNVDPNNYNPPSPVSFNVASITSDGLGTATAVLSTGQANKIGNGIVNTNVQILGADQPEYNVFKTNR